MPICLYACMPIRIYVCMSVCPYIYSSRAPLSRSFGVEPQTELPYEQALNEQALNEQALYPKPVPNLLPDALQ